MHRSMHVEICQTCRAERHPCQTGTFTTAGRFDRRRLQHENVIQEAVGYTAVSTCAFCADVAILYVLVHHFSSWYLAAVTASLVGLLLGYALSAALVFKYRRLKDRRLEFASFAAIRIVGLQSTPPP